MKFSLNWELDALSCGITGFLLLLPMKWLHGHVFTVFIAEAGGLFHLLYSVYVYPVYFQVLPTITWSLPALTILGSTVWRWSLLNSDSSFLFNSVPYSKSPRTCWLGNKDGLMCRTKHLPVGLTSSYQTLGKAVGRGSPAGRQHLMEGEMKLGNLPVYFLAISHIKIIRIGQDSSFVIVTEQDSAIEANFIAIYFSASSRTYG